ncbi:HAD family hydrolase [Castellaniella sp.]|uniref:HAD family hydrolase n=1 Tax=Castellaniella sp. TaxID=1955812 RepID=UPI003C748685
MIAVLDFDGTVCRKNSFPVWIKYCLKRAVREGRWRLLLRLSFLIFMRKILFIYDHKAFKKKVNEINYPGQWATRFCSDLVPDYDANVLAKLRELPCSHIVISTAAPECYAACIAFSGDLPLSHIICSRVIEGVFVDNSGLSKMVQTFRYMKQAGLSGLPLAVFTDHYSDSPLAGLADELFLCNPRKIDVEHYLSEGMRFTILGSK